MAGFCALQNDFQFTSKARKVEHHKNTFHSQKSRKCLQEMTSFCYPVRNSFCCMLISSAYNLTPSTRKTGFILCCQTNGNVEMMQGYSSSIKPGRALSGRLFEQLRCNYRNNASINFFPQHYCLFLTQQSHFFVSWNLHVYGFSLQQ